MKSRMMNIYLMKFTVQFFYVEELDVNNARIENYFCAIFNFVACNVVTSMASFLGRFYQS